MVHGRNACPLHPADVVPDEGVAKRTCATCGIEHVVCDSEDNHEEGARLRKFKCACKADLVNVGVSFSMHESGQAVRWLWVGHRCAKCGVLGSMAAWKAGYEPPLHLLTKA